MTITANYVVEIASLGAADCVLYTGVPKSTAWAFTYSGIDGATTARLRLNAAGTWERTTDGDEIACAAAAAALGDTVCDIYLYPMAKLGGMDARGTFDIDQGSGGSGSNFFGGAYRNTSMTVLECRKTPSETWTLGQTLYCNAADTSLLSNVSTGRPNQSEVAVVSPIPFKTSGAHVIGNTAILLQTGNTTAIPGDKITILNGIYTVVSLSGFNLVIASPGLIENVPTNTPATVPLNGVGYTRVAFALSVRGPLASFDRPSSAVKLAGSAISWKGEVSSDRDGKIIPYNSQRSSIFEGKTNATASLSGDVATTVFNPRNNCFGVPYVKAIEAILRTEQCWLVPTFGSTTYQTLLNRKALFGVNVYNYSCRRYRMLRTMNRGTADRSNLLFAPLLPSITQSWAPNIRISAPPDTYWTRTAPNDTGPGPLSQADVCLVLDTRGDSGIPGWQWSLWSTATTGVDTKIDCDHYRRANRFYTGSNPFDTTPIQHGSDAIIISPTWIKAGLGYGNFLDGTVLFFYDLSLPINLRYTGPSNTTDVQVSVWKTDAYGAKTQITAYATISGSGTTWTTTILPSAIGAQLWEPWFTSSVDHYEMRWRRYSPGTIPYASGTIPLRPNGSVGDGGGTMEIDWENRGPFPFPFHKSPLSLKTIAGSAISIPKIEGRYPSFTMPDVTWAGSLTVETATAFAGMSKFRIKSTLIPSAGALPFYYAAVDFDWMFLRIKRMSDGKFINDLVRDTATGATGLCWSKYAKRHVAQFQRGSFSGTYPSPLYAWNGAWMTEWYLLDIPPGPTGDPSPPTTETFGIEINFFSEFGFWDRTGAFFYKAWPEHFTVTI